MVQVSIPIQITARGCGANQGSLGRVLGLGDFIMVVLANCYKFIKSKSTLRHYENCGVSGRLYHIMPCLFIMECKLSMGQLLAAEMPRAVNLESGDLLLEGSGVTILQWKNYISPTQTTSKPVNQLRITLDNSGSFFLLNDDSLLWGSLTSIWEPQPLTRFDSDMTVPKVSGKLNGAMLVMDEAHREWTKGYERTASVVV